MKRKAAIVIAVLPGDSPMHAGHRAQRGFTLLELLVVVSILATLLAMLMPILTFAGREAKKSATRTVMVKVDTALRLFRADIGPYPFQSTYADLAGGASWTNRLYYHLGTDMDPMDYDRVVADANAAAALYATNGGSIHAYRKVSSPTSPDDPAHPSDNVETLWYADPITMSNRMAAERVRLAIYSGNTGITGGVLKIPYLSWRWVGVPQARRVLPTTPLLSSPTSAGRPGLAKDYLRGEVQSRYVDGECILDAWGRPIIYVCQVVEGMASTPMMGGSACVQLNVLDMGLHALGRKTLAETDAITGLPLVAHPVELPDLTKLAHSDRRHYAPRSLELEFELWSAGPDGRADWMRDAVVNKDNLPLQPYDKTIP